MTASEVAGVTTTATRPFRSASAALSAGKRSTASPPPDRSADASFCARASVSTTATCTTSAGLVRKAMPRPIASRMGKPNDQNSASGSRRYSLNRTLINCPSELGLRIAELPPGERYEHVLERRRVRGQLSQRRLATGEQREERRNRAVQRAHLQLVRAGQLPRGAHAVERTEVVHARRGRAVGDRELHDVLGAERSDQLERRAERDHFAVIDDRHAVAENLGLVHVVRGEH